MEANHIKTALAARAEEVAQHLFPNGRRQGSEWVVGSPDGEAGTSMKINLNGKAGVWRDFAGDEGGDNLLELWRVARGVEFSEACKQAEAFLGVSPRGDYAKRLVRPCAASKPRPAVIKAAATDRMLDPSGEVCRYLTESRKLSPESLRTYGVADGVVFDGGKEWRAAVFPMKGEGGTLENIKRIGIERRDNGKKRVSAETGGAHILFGKNVVGEQRGEILIAEGEIDALSWHTVGIGAVSVPFGAGNHQWLENDFDWLAEFDRILIAFDDDDAGRKGASELALRIGREKCFLVEMPEGVKDANEALQKGMADKLAERYGNAKPVTPPELRQAADFIGEVEAMMAGEAEPGLPVFFTGAWKVRPHEVTVWTGFSGHGKTMLLNQIIGDLVEGGETACVASLEQRPKKTLLDIVRQRSRKGEPSSEDLKAGWVERLWFFDHVGSRDWRELIEVSKYAHRRFGVTQFVIDSLLKCGIAGDDYNEQKTFIEALSNFVSEFPVHVHLVAHAKKLQDETRPPDKLDVKGSGDITDLVCNGLTIWRNKAKERGIDEARMKGAIDREAELRTKPDAKVLFWKQRETGEEPIALLDFDPVTKRFSTM